MDEIMKCIFAGDKSDEFCCKCNGITMEIDSSEGITSVPATKCGGYQAAEEYPQIPNEIKPIDIITPTQNENIIEEEPKEIIEEIKVQGVTKEIQISSSVSKEIQGQWFKLTYSETRTIPEGADLEAERKALWNTCNDEVDNQIKNIN